LFFLGFAIPRRVLQRCFETRAAPIRGFSDRAEARCLQSRAGVVDNPEHGSQGGHVLEAIETETGQDPHWTVIWLHGLGADGHDFAPIVPQLVPRHWPAIRFVFPHAPIRPVTVNRGMRMRAWYDIVGVDIGSRQDESGVRDSIAAIDPLIAREAQRGIPAARVLLAGFSQGGAIALATGLRHPERLAGIVALSTYVPIAAKLEPELRSDSLPIFMGHGTADPVVPHALGTMSRVWLGQHGHDVEWHSYPMPHSVCAEEIRDLQVWMGRRFGPG
jgi:phospholipase/carboxylesterase